jgi:hypothetical protein
MWVAGCWVQFPKDAASASANYGHLYSPVGIFSLGFAYYFKKFA